MLDIKTCRETLGETGKQLTDKEIIKLRDDMYYLAEIFLADYFENKESSP